MTTRPYYRQKLSRALLISKSNRGTYKVRNEIETKRNEINENETKRNEINKNETKRNEINEMKTE